MALTDTGLHVFEALTRRPFLVIDTEYEPTADGNHLISLAVVPVIRGNKGPASDELYVEMNPGVPIDDATSAVHGFTDADVARKRPFAHYATRILGYLAKYPDAIVVSHTGVDIHLLRDELTRLGDTTDDDAHDAPAATSLDDLPDLPLIDTSALPRLLRLDGAERRPALGLARLCSLLDITNAKPHNARSDARATAAALVKLLLHAAERHAYPDIDDLLADHDRGTTRQPRIASVGHRRRTGEPALPDTHLARHTTPLLDAATKAQLADWTAMARECIALRCRHLADAADVAARENGPAVLAALTRLLTDCNATGHAGTLLGAVKRVVSVPDATTPPITAQLGLRWLASHRPPSTPRRPATRTKAAPRAPTAENTPAARATPSTTPSSTWRPSASAAPWTRAASTTACSVRTQTARTAPSTSGATRETPHT